MYYKMVHTKTCEASSLAGTTIQALGLLSLATMPWRCSSSLKWWIIGARYAMVFPEPGESTDVFVNHTLSRLRFYMHLLTFWEHFSFADWFVYILEEVFNSP